MRSLSRVRILTAFDKELLLSLKSAVLRFVPNAAVILYGSAARGKRGPDSDYDVLILLEEPISKRTQEEMRSTLYDLELEHNTVVSVIVSTRDEWTSPLAAVSPYHKNVEREGVLL